MLRNGDVRPWRFSRLWAPVLIFGALTNLLMLTGPLFMLQVYERVLPSSSVPTLAVLFALVIFLYAMMALLDSARSRILIRIAARLRKKLERRLLDGRLQHGPRSDVFGPGGCALQDLEIVHRTLSSPAVLAMLDTPWTFAFLALLFFFHPLLGVLATFGGLALVLLALVGHWRARAPPARSRSTRSWPTSTCPSSSSSTCSTSSSWSPARSPSYSSMTAARASAAPAP